MSIWNHDICIGCEKYRWSEIEVAADEAWIQLRFDARIGNFRYNISKTDLVEDSVELKLSKPTKRNRRAPEHNANLVRRQYIQSF